MRLAILVGLLCAGCAAPQTERQATPLEPMPTVSPEFRALLTETTAQPASNADIEAAAGRYNACIDWQVSGLDDTASDARTIARAAVTACKHHLAEAGVGVNDPATVSRLTDSASVAVLRHRSNSSAP